MSWRVIDIGKYGVHVKAALRRENDDCIRLRIRNVYTHTNLYLNYFPSPPIKKGVSLDGYNDLCWEKGKTVATEFLDELLNVKPSGGKEVIKKRIPLDT